ncbi:hypothetical protein [Candidatus Ichthyocystis hellenicum]|uniref:hypothetical protein n=1 Tax=Candidatus Ichthyocystis hellenicum TaxID=1561003 RepID=UPI000A49970B|nr:hypothetical protein [Candidatus Ichthyocystis hellenicum]
MHKTLSPLSLEELAIGTIFGISKKKSIEQLMHLSHKEAIELIVTLNNNRAMRTKYESALGVCNNTQLTQVRQNNSKLFCNDFRNLDNYPELVSITSLKHHINKIINEYDNNLSKTLPPKHENNSNHPICQLLYTENTVDIIKNYREKRNEILSLPPPPTNELLPDLQSQEKISYYYDPLIFLETRRYCDYIGPSYQCMNLFIEIIINPILESSSTIFVYSRNLISSLARSRKHIRKQTYYLFMALLSQIKTYASSFQKLAYKKLSEKTRRSSGLDSNLNPAPINDEKSILMSLHIVICLRNLIKCIHTLKKKFFPILELHNYIPAENIIGVFIDKVIKLSAEIKTVHEIMTTEKRNASIVNVLGEEPSAWIMEIEKRESDILLSKIEIEKISSFLTAKYPPLIMSRKFVISYLLDKINSNSNTNKLIEELTKEIKEMELFLVKLTPSKVKHLQ